MKIGFLGAGAITSAIVTGLSSFDGERPAIRLSPRNAKVAAELAGRFSNVAVCSSNQEVLDACEVVMIAVRPQIAADVVAELRFRADHEVISLVSGYSLQKLDGLVAPATKITRAVPLPSTAKRRCPTGIYPGDQLTHEIFSTLGAAFEVDSEAKFNAYCTATATMAAYFAFSDCVASWLSRNGIVEQDARDYTARIFAALAQTAVESPQTSFHVLADEHATKGGINEQVLRQLNDHGVFQTFSEALDGIMVRVSAASR